MKVQGKEVFSAELDAQGKVVQTEGLDFSNRLSEVFISLKELCNLGGLPSLQIFSECDFPLNWGLGTSSTLIYSLSNFFGVDPYALLECTFGGSGYDIACASAKGPGIFRLHEHQPTWENCAFKPTFADHIHFIHLNQKKDSREAIAQFKEKMKGDQRVLISKVNDLTNQMLEAKDIISFSETMRIHEDLLSNVLGMPTVGMELFPDYEHATKSLGGWGGDFIMALGDAAEMNYFRKKGFETVIPFDEMILNKVE